MEDVTNEESLFPQYDPTKDLSQAPKNRTKRGLGARPLLESEIKDVQQKARSAAEAARMLGVSYNTYKKYAKEYGVFEDLKNPFFIYWNTVLLLTPNFSEQSSTVIHR